MDHLSTKPFLARYYPNTLHKFLSKQIIRNTNKMQTLIKQEIERNKAIKLLRLESLN